MSKIKEKLKKIGSALNKVGDWVGNHLGTVLTIGSVVLGFLFLRERGKRQEAETEVEMKDEKNIIASLKEEVQANEDDANASLADYESAKSARSASKRKQGSSRTLSGSKKRAPVRVRKRTK
jgi:hypothetical protein